MLDHVRACQTEFARLVAELSAGRIRHPEFLLLVAGLQLQAPNGDRWGIDPASGGWQRWDGRTWVPGDPLTQLVPSAAPLAAPAAFAPPAPFAPPAAFGSPPAPFAPPPAGFGPPLAPSALWPGACPAPLCVFPPPPAMFAPPAPYAPCAAAAPPAPSCLPPPATGAPRAPLPALFPPPAPFAPPAAMAQPLAPAPGASPPHAGQPTATPGRHAPWGGVVVAAVLVIGGVGAAVFFSTHGRGTASSAGSGEGGERSPAPEAPAEGAAVDRPARTPSLPPAEPPRPVGDSVTSLVGAAGASLALDDRIFVSVPAGALADDRTLSIRRAEGGPPLPSREMTALGTFSVSLGGDDRETFPKEIQIELAYRPEDLGVSPGDAEGEALAGLAYFDTRTRSWIGVPTTIDPVRHRLVARTPHLCDWIAWTFKGYRLLPAEGTHFEIYYHPRHAVPAPRSPETTMREYAEDVRGYFETAWKAYKAAGFEMPEKVDAVITDDVAESEWNPVTGTILLARASLSTDAIAQHDAGHELFHAVQNHYHNIFSMGGTGQLPITEGREWWIEGTPDYASWAVVWGQRTELPEIMPFYFEESIALNRDKVHAYQLSNLLRYLVEARGANFKDLWDHVAKNSKVPETTLTQLSIYVTKVCGDTFEGVWTSWMTSVLFEPKSPMSQRSFDSLMASSKPTRMPEKVREATHAFALKGAYTMKPWKITVLLPKDQDKEMVVVEAAANVPDGVALQLRVLPGDRRAVGGGALKQILTGSTKKSEPIELGPDDALYVLAVSTTAAGGAVTAKVKRVAADVTTGPDGTWEGSPAFGGGQKVVVTLSGGASSGTFSFGGSTYELACSARKGGWDCKGREPGRQQWETIIQIEEHVGGRLRLLAPPCILYKRGVKYPGSFDDPQTQAEDMMKELERDPLKYVPKDMLPQGLPR